MPDRKTTPAVVCDMTSAPDSPQERLAEYARLLDAAFVARERTAAGVRWRLRADPGIEAWARDLAARENACCAFMSVAVTLAGGHVLWDVAAIDDPVARGVLDLFYNLPGHRPPDVGAMRAGLERTGVPVVIADGAATRRLRAFRRPGSRWPRPYAVSAR
jgi:hypothetical protein